MDEHELGQLFEHRSIIHPAPIQFRFDAFAGDSDNILPVTEAPTESTAIVGADSLTTNPVHTNWRAALVSTLASIAIVVSLLTAVRFFLPPTLESARYAWYRGQLRAEHDDAGHQMQSVRLDSISDLSSLVSRRVTPAVVHIDVRLPSSSSKTSVTEVSDARTTQREFSFGQGSGVVVDEAGYILTNYHVLEGAERIEVLLSDRRRLPAKLVGMDEQTDIAVLRINADGLMAVAWGDSDKLDVGSAVWAVGSPFGLNGSITFGIVSSKHRIDLRGTRFDVNQRSMRPVYSDLIQTDVAINPGNSGGPLVDKTGALIGINTAIVGEDYRGVSFAIPSSVAKSCFEQILKNGSVDRSWLGVVLPDNDSDSMRFRAGENVAEEGSMRPYGVVIQGFASGNASPAIRAGLRIGDRIVEFNGEKIMDSLDLRSVLARSPSGVEIPFTIVRDGKELSLIVELQVRSPFAN